ncbi:MAG: TPM domain-containing protein, partial [Candidatus Limnocylindrales bacterium]
MYPVTVMVKLATATLGLLALALLAAAPAAAAGPPYPSPVAGQYVYDTAGVFAPTVIDHVQAEIAAIQARSGVEIVVYTQVRPGVDEQMARDDADALGNQWGVGQRGFDNGLVILFDLDASRCHGQVRLDPGSGFAATYLSEGDLQAIYENDMLPHLAGGACDMNGAVMAAVEYVDASITPARQQQLQSARQINAVVGLIIAPLALLLLAGYALMAWWRRGRDPTYTDDPSVLMAGPPEALTAATAALVYDDRSTRHTLTTAMVDLASRGELAFAPEGGGSKVGIRLLEAQPDDAATAAAQRRPLSDAETFLLTALHDTSPDYLDPTDVLAFGRKTPEFDKRLEQHAVTQGWFARPPGSLIRRWSGLGAVEVVLAGVAGVIGYNLPSSGLILLAVALGVAGVATLGLAQVMPARTLDGARIQAMLRAYRRTLQATMAQARSMPQVVEQAKLPWLDTPDLATVWGVALGLQDDVQAVLLRTFDDQRAAGATGGVPAAAWFPIWYSPAWTSATSPAQLHSGTGLFAAGSFSGSPLPNFGGMFAALGTIG